MRPQRMSDAPLLLLGSGLRMAAWLNAGAALLLVSFSLGIVGGDVAAPDLLLPVSMCLAGLAAACMGLVFGAVAGLVMSRTGDAISRRHWPAHLMAMLCLLASAGGFAAGCWLAASAAAVDGPQMSAIALS